jgi:quercetin dioxygenase-like cupin family protein
MPELPAPRRVVTGHNAQGVGVLVCDGPPPAARTVSDGATFHDLWVTALSPAPITATEPEPIRAGERLGPPDSGTRVRICDMPPGLRSPMHRTESVDYGVVLAGEITLVLDGAETVLHAGDVAIQRGTEHAWENRSRAPARMLFVLVAGRFDPELLASLPESTGVTDDVM